MGTARGLTDLRGGLIPALGIDAQDGLSIEAIADAGRLCGRMAFDVVGGGGGEEAMKGGPLVLVTTMGVP